jgi:hypothetical protein
MAAAHSFGGMIEASCHCGAVKFEIAHEPEDVGDCNCSICRRLGALWAYYPLADVKIIPASGATDTYMWNDRILAFHRCKICGCTTHWYPVDTSHDRMGVNARMMSPVVLAAVPVRKLDGASW